MEGYPGRLPGAARETSDSAARRTIEEAGDFLRRLIPFPGSETVSPLALLSLAPGGATDAGQAGAQTNPVVAAAGFIHEPAASIVSQAASVLDEEMAKGVLTARAAGAPSGIPYDRPDLNNPVLRQMHEFVNNLAALWPSLESAPGLLPVNAAPASSDAEPVVEVGPRATVKPGERATITMTIRNSEHRPVRLVPAATDLLGSRGGQIRCTLLEFTPPELGLEAHEERELAIAATVPADAEPGCYSGLLVVRGLDYLRALITIDVG